MHGWIEGCNFKGKKKGKDGQYSSLTYWDDDKIPRN